MMLTILDFFNALALILGWSVILTTVTVIIVFLFFLVSDFLDPSRKPHSRR